MTTHMTQHYQSLQRMYLSAPINQLYLPEIVITEGEARIGIELREDFHHAAGAVHGSVYFKMLDDAAYLIRPVSSGVMRSEGRVVSRTRSQFIAESVVYDGRGRELARGSGIFVKGRPRLKDAAGYGVD